MIDLERIKGEYQGQLVCARCGCDPDGRQWPTCADYLAIPEARSVIHEATCARYWAGDLMWVCDDCERVVLDREGLE